MNHYEEKRTAAPASQEVSEEAHGWLYDAITAKGGQDLIAANTATAGSMIGFTISGKPYVVRMTAVPDEEAGA